MELVADRFVRRADGSAVDLATGLRVHLRLAAVDAALDARWAAECDLFARLRHPAIAPLVDYGPIGRAERFEAWQCGPVWDGSPAEANAARSSACRFLRAAALAANDEGASVHVRSGGAVIVPVVDAREADEAATIDRATVPLAERGLLHPDGPPLAALAEMFRSLDGPRLHAAAVWGPTGSGRTTLVRQLARLARLNGFVPLAARFLQSAARPLWRGRSLLLIADAAGDGWSALLDAAIASPKPHALLIVGDREVPGIDGVALQPVAIDRLIETVRPGDASPPLARELRRLAVRSAGWPGRFAQILAGAATPAVATVAGADRRGARVAESSAAYGGDERVAIGTPPRPPVAWPAPGELASIRRRVADAASHAAAGRHAAAVRTWRQAAAALARRGAWSDAAAATIQLARMLLQRGQPRDAETALDSARDYAGRGGVASLLSEAAVLAGEMWIDRLRLDEAEAVLTAASTATLPDQDPERRAHAAIALARCLFWRGRYDAAYTTINRLDASTMGLRGRRWLAKIAAARGDVGSALRFVGELTTFDQDPSAAPTAAAAETSALVYLAAGDSAAAAARAQAALHAARLGHDPLRAIAARYLLAEADRRRGQSTAAAAQLARLRRLARSLPPLVQAQLNPEDHVGTLPALRLWFEPVRTPSDGDLPVLDQVMAIVRACQTADDELVILRDVCARVRQQLYAASVAFVTTAADRLTVLASDGARADLDVARRCVDSGIVIAPHRIDDRTLAGAPIQYGGATIGALLARWTLGATGDQSHAAAVLAATAVAAAPLVAAATVHRQRAPIAADRELLGVTPAMEEVRRLIDRAATAPFSVLVCGESGTGKELAARAIHRGSARRDRPFRTVNCAAIPDDLAEAELFGHIRGAFTGAIGDRTGVFEEAHGGTLFLDEVGELTPRAQAKLLRVLQEGEVRRVGENVPRRVDVRIVAATNRDLGAECEAGRFRLDLLYRLDVIRIALPALRDRTEDVPLLVEHFWRDATARIGSRATLSASTIAALARYHWPGNIRELQNILASLAVRCPKRGLVLPTALPPAFVAPHGSPAWRLEEARRVFEERFVRAALARSGGHRARAAAELGVTRQGLTKLLSRLGIS